MSVLTVGAIAKECGASKDQVNYIIGSRGIEPVARAGQYRMFDADAVRRIRHELKAIKSRREAASV